MGALSLVSKSLLVALVSSFVVVVAGQDRDYRIGCYITYWSIASGAYPLDKIEPKWCTHLYYAFVQIKNDQLAPYDDDAGKFSDTMDGLRKIRDANPDLKILLSVGGGNAGSDAFLAVSETAEKRQAFANSSVHFLREYDLDGLDVDWENSWCYQGWDPEKHASLIEALYSGFKEDNGERELYLTTALLPITTYITYNASCHVIDDTPRPYFLLDRLKDSLDFALLMTYDMRGAWNGVTGLHSALYGLEEPGENWDDVIEAFVQGGLPREKVDAGIPLYGRSYVLAEPANNNVGDLSTGAGSFETPFYATVCENVVSNGWTRVFDNVRKCPYAYNASQWVGYEDAESSTLKAEYIKDNLGGTFFWSMEMEDMANTCQGGYSPVVEAVVNILRPPPTIETPTEGEPDSTTPPVTTSVISSTADPPTSSLTSTPSSINSSPTLRSTSNPFVGSSSTVHAQPLFIGISILLLVLLKT